MKKKDEILSMLYKLTVAVSELEDQAHVHVTNDVFPPDSAGTDFPRTGNDPVPRWRALVENAIRDTPRTWPYDSALANVLDHLTTLAHEDVTRGACADSLARIVAVAECQVGYVWKADPGWVPHGHWDIAWLLAMLSHEPPNWTVVADRAAAWLRDITTDGGAE